MADRIPIRLEGGPCDGRNTTARVADFGPVAVTCKSVTYDPTARSTKDNRLIYTTRASQQPPPTAAGGHVAAPNRAHNAWHGMLHNVFVDAPKELRRSADARKAMLHLKTRRGLR